MHTVQWKSDPDNYVVYDNASSAIAGAATFNENMHRLHGMPPWQGRVKSLNWSDTALSIAMDSGTLSYVGTGATVEPRLDTVVTNDPSLDTSMLIKLSKGNQFVWHRSSIAKSYENAFFLGTFFSDRNQVFLYFQKREILALTSFVDAYTGHPYLFWTESN